MAIGTVTVDLLAKTGSFETDMQRAAKIAEASSKQIAKSAEAAGLAIGVALTAAGTAAIAMANSSIDALAKLDDMTQKTGSSVEQLSKIQQTAGAFGQSFEEVDSAISKLAKGMATVDSETNKTNKALAALGLSARDATGAMQDPAKLFTDIAKKLQDYQDGASKAALMTDLFGKAGANLLPFMNDLAENVDKFTGATAESAAQAAHFQDQLGLARQQTASLAQSITADLLPAMNRFLETMAVVKQTSIIGWLTTSGDEMDNAGKRINDINRELANLQQQRADFDKANPLAKMFSAEDAKILDVQIAALQKQKVFLQGIQQMQALSGGKLAPDQTERQGTPGVLDYTTGNPPKEAAARKTQYEKDLEAAQKLIETLKTQVVTFGEGEAAAVNYRLAMQGLPAPIIATATALQQQLSDMKLAKQVTDDMMAEQERRDEIQQQGFQKTMEALYTNEQSENALHNQRVSDLKAYGDKYIEQQTLVNGMIEQENQRHNIAMQTMQAGYQLQAIQSTSQTFDTLYQIFVNAGKEQTAAARAIFIAQKALAVAEILINTELGAAKAVGQFGPFGIPLATVIKAMGYAQAGLVAGMAIAGQREQGGPVQRGSAYIVGEAGREMFVPNTNGTIIPNHVLEGGGSGKEHITIVNNTRGRIDSVQTRQLSATERAIIIDEAVGAAASDMSNPNGRMSRALNRNYATQRSR